MFTYSITFLLMPLQFVYMSLSVLKDTLGLDVSLVSINKSITMCVLVMLSCSILCFGVKKVQPFFFFKLNCSQLSSCNKFHVQ